MDMYHIGEFGDCGMFAHQHAHLLYNISRMGAIGMTT